MKTKKMLLILLSILMTIMIFTGCSSKKSTSQIEVVDNQILSLYQDRSFNRASEEEQKEKIEKKLNELEEDKQISKVKYDDNTKVFTFKYADGTRGGIALNASSHSVDYIN